MGLEAEVKAGNEALKKNWMYFLAFAAVVGIAFLWWDHKKSGGVVTWLASKPLIGKLFA